MAVNCSLKRAFAELQHHYARTHTHEGGNRITNIVRTHARGQRFFPYLYTRVRGGTGH
jgi:hypothetical protein